MSILMVTGIEGAYNCAEVMGKQLALEVVVAEGRKSALALLHQREFAAVVVDESIAECDPAAAEAIWQRSGLAIPLQINFALCGLARLVREIRAALGRREREQTLAYRAAAGYRIEFEIYPRRASSSFAACLVRERRQLCRGRETAHRGLPRRQPPSAAGYARLGAR